MEVVLLYITSNNDFNRLLGLEEPNSHGDSSLFLIHTCQQPKEWNRYLWRKPFLVQRDQIKIPKLKRTFKSLEKPSRYAA